MIETMRVRVVRPTMFSICIGLSVFAWLACALLFVMSFTSIFGGCLFFGDFTEAITPIADPTLPNWHSYLIHREYHGGFLLNGRMAIGHLSEHSRIGLANPIVPTRQGRRWVAGVSNTPFASGDPRWHLPGIESVDLGYSNPRSMESGRARCVRVHLGIALLLLGVLPAWWVVRRVRAARESRRKGFEVSAVSEA